MVPGDASCDDFLVKAEECQDRKKRIFRCCYQDFNSELEFEKHLRIHSRRHRAKSKTVVLDRNSEKVDRKNYPQEDDDNGFRCFVCHHSFPTMQLLLRHTRNHREKLPIMSEEESSLSDEPETSSVQEQRVDGRKRTVNGEKVYDPQPLSIYVPPVEETKDSHDSYPSKKLKSEGTIPNQVASMESESRTANNIPKLSLGLQTQYGFPNFSHGRSKSHNRANSNTGKTVHQCEICGKTFETGQSLGGHKTYHRNKQPSDGTSRPSSLLMVRGKAEEQLPAETGMVTETSNFNRMLLPGAANSSEESYQEHSQFQTQSNLPNFSRAGRLKSHTSANSNTVKSVQYQCEICGKTFETGQALGGHKTCHRNEKLSDDPFRPRGLLTVRKKAEQWPAETTSTVGETSNFTSMLLPGTTNSSEESYQEHSQFKKVLGFDLNIPYVED